MESDKYLSIKLILAFAATYFIWGSTYLFIRFAVDTIPPFLMAGVRFIIAGAILYAFSITTSKERPTLVHWKSAAIAGVLMLGLGNGLVTWAEKTVPSGLAALVIATVPLWMVLLEWLGYKQKPGGMAVAGAILGILGISLLIDPAEISNGTGVDLIGFAALMIAAIAWASGSLYSRSAELPKSGFLSAASQMLAGGLFLILIGLATGETLDDFSSFSLLSVLSLLYLIVFGSLIALTAYMWLIKNTAPAKATTYAFVNPIIAVFLGWAFAGEVIGVKTLLSLALVVVAVILVLRSRAGARRKAPIDRDESHSQRIGKIAVETE